MFRNNLRQREQVIKNTSLAFQKSKRVNLSKNNSN